MKSILHLIVIFTYLYIFSSAKSHGDLAQKYVEMVINRTTAAFNYEFPTDARMYEPEDNAVEGQ